MQAFDQESPTKGRRYFCQLALGDQLAGPFGLELLWVVSTHLAAVMQLPTTFPHALRLLCLANWEGSPMRTALFVATIMLLISSMADTVFAKDIAVCGESSGYGFYPKFGLAASNEDAGKWVEDAISSGKFTLIQTSEKEFDLLINDASGRIHAAKQDGGVLLLTGAAEETISILVTYPPRP